MKYDFTTNEYVYTRVNGSTYRCLDSFPTIVQPMWTNNPNEWDLEKKITWDEIAPSLQELIIRKLKFSDLDNPLQTRIITMENNISTNAANILVEKNARINADQLLQNQVDSLKSRMSSAESRLTVLEDRMDEAERQIYLIWIEIRKLWQEIYDIWGSDGKVAPDHDITHIWEKIEMLEEEVNNLWDKLGDVEGDLEKIKTAVDNNMSITITKDAGWRSTGGHIIENIGEYEYFIWNMITSDARPNTQATLSQRWNAFVAAPASGSFYVEWDTGCIPYKHADAAQHALTKDEVSITEIRYTGWHNYTLIEARPGYEGNPWGTPRGHTIFKYKITGNFNAGDKVYVGFEVQGFSALTGFSKDGLPDNNLATVLPKIATWCAPGETYLNPATLAARFRVYA